MQEENIKYKEKVSTRKFKPTFMALDNKNTIYILTLFLIVAGWMGYTSMQREQFPEIVIPYISVSTPHPGNSPLDIENLITRPLEKELKDLNGVKKMSSNSFQDMSLIIVEFEADVSVEQAKLDVKDKVDKAISELPDDLMDDPIVDDIDFSEFPVLNINLSGDYSIYELKKFAEGLQDEFETLREVREADIRGVDEREIKIHVDPHRMAAYDLTFSDIEFAVQTENFTVGAGEVKVDGTRRSIRVQADYTNMDQIRNTIVKEIDGRVVYIKDVAEVIDGFEEQSTISRLDHKSVVTLSIVKKSGQNLLDATDKILGIIKQKQESETLPKDLTVTVTDDQSVFVRDQISNLENSILLGMIFVMIVLYMFLGLRNAIFSGLAIPMSMIISMMILKQIGYTINTMVLFSLVLALGMLVDNAIVVIENVYRMMEHGVKPEKAVKNGTSEIAIPIISSTATTLAAFFPLVFWPGIVGKFMSYLPITLIIVLASSLFVALVLNPVFASQFMKLEDVREKKSFRKYFIVTGVLAALGLVFYLSGNLLWGNLLVLPLLITTLNKFVLKPSAIWFQHSFLPMLENMYEATLRKSLGRKTSKGLLFGSIGLFVFSVMFFGAMQPKVFFFPENEPRTIYVTMELPLGTDIEVTDEVTKNAEEILYSTLDPYMDIVKSVGVSVGNGKGGLFESGRSPNKSLTTITFLDYQFRQGHSTREIMSKLSDAFQGFVGAKVFIEKEENGPPVGKPINIEVGGDDYEKLIALTEDIKRTINEDHILGIENLEMDLNTNKPEMQLFIDRDKVRRMGLSTQQVAMALRTSLYGKEISKYKDGEDEYDIMLRMKDKYRYDVSTLMNQKMKVDKNGVVSLIPISAVASYEYASTYEKIIRIDNTRVITLSSNVVEGYNANTINARIKTLLSDYQMPANYNWKMTGEQESQQETSDFLVGALLFALALIAMILITQFNSGAKPLIIIGTVGLSTIGVFMGLGTFQMDFIILMTGVGIVSLAGIVVNNGIVLIDYIDLVRGQVKEKKGLGPKGRLSREDEVDSIVRAGKTRLRPVLLTAITTILGLIPMAVGLNFDFFSLFSELDPKIYFGGDNADFWAPMAWTVIFGLSTSTVLTLIMAPVMYNLAVRIRNRMVKEKVEA
ncbi:efflux RND transporter permease subunit [Carboxylicivirga sp. A043]|uniref:efflux RND transporter permease subunit n=1 Tax=Carboxylicivirga litoralis TaxID=2816963 RepID=UPI0021CB0B91|nr:efflux RND transporter permease subunit [Carboxylicivirga sp. A043]MCU4158082.1 efflux RND transporter permease subunit [Carboxylicivirga sp. A043]